MDPKWNIETIAIQGGYEPKATEPRILPIIQSTTYKYDSAEHVAKLFDLEAADHMYTRISNPTTAGFETKTSIVPLDQIPRALAARDTRGLIKLVADAKTDRLLGAQILAPEGADSIQTMVLALKNGMTAKSLGETVFPYLTTVEGIKLAAQSFDKDVSKLSCCAG